MSKITDNLLHISQMNENFAYNNLHETEKISKKEQKIFDSYNFPAFKDMAC